MHGIFACNTAFDHPARHKTTWQGQRRDVATNQVVPIYCTTWLTLFYVLILTSPYYKTQGPTLAPNHRLVVVRANISRVFGVRG